MSSSESDAWRLPPRPSRARTTRSVSSDLSSASVAVGGVSNPAALVPSSFVGEPQPYSESVTRTAKMVAKRTGLEVKSSLESREPAADDRCGRAVVLVPGVILVPRPRRVKPPSDRWVYSCRNIRTARARSTTAKILLNVGPET